MTAAEKLMLLRQPALCDLIRNHMILRSVKEPLDPVLLTKLAHDLLQMASDAERAEMRRVA